MEFPSRCLYVQPELPPHLWKWRVYHPWQQGSVSQWEATPIQSNIWSIPQCKYMMIDNFHFAKRILMIWMINSQSNTILVPCDFDLNTPPTDQKAGNGKTKYPAHRPLTTSMIRVLSYKVKTQYVQILNVYTSMVNGCLDKCFILPLVVEGHWSSAIFFRNLPW